jgi:hypothetical protein
LIISEDQAIAIAECIMFDIPAYIKEHQLEYQQFLENETKSEAERNKENEL